MGGVRPVVSSIRPCDCGTIGCPAGACGVGCAAGTGWGGGAGWVGVRA
jgi:hypothetical protein